MCIRMRKELNEPARLVTADSAKPLIGLETKRNHTQITFQIQQIVFKTKMTCQFFQTGQFNIAHTTFQIRTIDPNKLFIRAESRRYVKDLMLLVDVYSEIVRLCKAIQAVDANKLPGARLERVCGRVLQNHFAISLCRFRGVVVYKKKISPASLLFLLTSLIGQKLRSSIDSLIRIQNVIQNKIDQPYA